MNQGRVEPTVGTDITEEMFLLELGTDFIGMIEIGPSEKVENVCRSKKASIGVDELAPSTEVIYPKPGSSVVKVTFQTFVKLWEKGG